MEASASFYLCPTCFNISESARECHGRQMIRCDPGTPSDERRKPLTDAEGHLKSHAPRWFLEAVGSLPTPQAHRAVPKAALA